MLETCHLPGDLVLPGNGPAHDLGEVARLLLCPAPAQNTAVSSILQLESEHQDTLASQCFSKVLRAKLSTDLRIVLQYPECAFSKEKACKGLLRAL